tara:strand:+ start:2344 stop:3039 length:696 start_codon:yes stop_codon:yes gene_type:complete
MILFNGCSWTYGDELENNVEEGYPNLVAQKLGLPFVNLARNGASNDYIYHTSLEYLLNNKVDLAIIQWTFPTRFGIYRDSMWENFIPHSFLKLKFNYRVRDKERRLTIEERNEEDDFSSSFLKMYSNMLGIYTYCFYKNIPLITFNNTFKHIKLENELFTEHNSYPKILSKTVDSFCEINFNEYIIQHLSGPRKNRWNKFGHPTKLAHQVWSSYIYNKAIEKYGNTLHQYV